MHSKHEAALYKEYRDKWVQYFLSKGFTLIWQEDHTYGDYSSYLARLDGCHPRLRAEIYSGKCRTNTETGGRIGVDFCSAYNKLSQCPVYCDLTESEDSMWSAIVLLMETGESFSNHLGRIIKQGGAWVCDPPIYNIKDKQRVIKRSN
jgi:hypothetical protein